MVKAVKCPAILIFSQIEGHTMVFPRSSFEGMLYDVVSLMEADETGRVSQLIVRSIEGIPSLIGESYEIKLYK